MIIEFNGLPGTGKTTVSKELERIFKAKDICCNMYGRLPAVTKKELVICFIKGGWKIYLNAFVFAKNEIQSTDKTRKQIALLILAYYHLYCKYDKTGIDKILICDQGIFQALVSIAHIDKIKSSKHAQKVMDVIKNFEIKFINCEVDPQLSEERLKFRKNGGSRFDKMNEEERTANLLKQQDNFKILRNCLKETVNPDKIIKIDTRNETISNAQLIFDEIVKK